MSAQTSVAADEADAAFQVVLPARPYPGLRPYDEAEWPIFFGRERMVDAVVARLVASHFVAVHGDSGSGKSSLIRAGVLPRLSQEQARGGARWRTCIALPRGGPLLNIANALARLDGRSDDTEHVLALRRALNLGRRAPAALAGLMLRDAHDHLCLLIDQFEELFEFARGTGGAEGAGEARLLTDALVALAESPPRGLYLVLTMRSEFLGACARFTGLAETVNAQQYLLPPMSAADLVRAVREPAPLFDGEVAPALAERLAADAAGIDGLPLVQHALMLLHRAKAAQGSAAWRLDAEDYPAQGLAGLLSDHADAVAASVSPASAAAGAEPDRVVEDLLRALTTTNAEGHALRRPQPLGRLAAVTGAPAQRVREVVDAFRADGVSFMTPRCQDGAEPVLADDAVVDIGHESLIRCWRVLADPEDGWLVREFQNGLVWRSLLVQADSFERDAGNLLSPATAGERSRWMLRRNPDWADRYGGGWPRVQALVAASVKHRDELERLRASEMAARAGEQRARERYLTAIGALGGAVLLMAFAGWQWLQANDARDQALAASQFAEAQRQRAEVLLESTRASTDELSRSLEALRAQRPAEGSAGSGATAPPPPQAVQEAYRKLNGVANDLRRAQAQAQADSARPPTDFPAKK